MIIMFFHSFIAMEYAFTLFFAVSSSINAAGDHLAGGSFTEKELNERLFPKLRTQSLWCSGEVYSRRVDGAGFESY